VGIRLKFNLLLVVISAIGLSVFGLVAGPAINAVARDEVIQSARIMMESAAGARKYTSEQITPLLQDRLQHRFYPQAVSAYAAKRSLDVVHAKFPDYLYREAALNPTNSEDRPADWEADLINSFRANPQTSEISMLRSTPTGRMIQLARPIVAKPACLECHGEASKAPPAMVAIYGDQNGFGWKPNEIVAAQIVSVPIKASTVRAGYITKSFLLPFIGLVVVFFVAVNLLLHFVIIRPITGIASTAEAVSMGEIDTPEYRYNRADEIGRLASSFTRMHRSIVEAFRMLGKGAMDVS
jgi:HAMP domain-containing protein